MAEIDPLVAEILLKGDDQFLSSLQKVGEKAEEAFHKLSTSVKNGATSAEALTGSLGLLEGALAGVVAATVLFVEQQTELSQKTILLADAFGVQAGQLQDLEAVFASSGVKVEQFERFANRLTITIAREWPQITESIRTYANENDAAQLRVQNAMLRVQDAQKALGDNSAERAAQMAKDNDAVEASYIKLQFAAQHAASEQLGAWQSLDAAQNGLIAAQQHLATLEGRPPSSAEKANLALAQAQNAVDQARRAESDARIAQQEKAAGAALKQRQMEQEYDDLARKAAKNARDDAEKRQKDENAVKEAIIARGEAEEKVNKLALTSVASIRGALDGIVSGNKDAAKAVDLTEVSVQNLIKGVIALAAENSKSKEPSGYETMIALSKVLSKATADQISEEQKLAIVNRVAATGMQALGGVGAELLHVLEHDTEELQKFSEQAKALDTKEAKDAIEKFRGALAGLNLTISILSQRFAIAVSPAFTAFLRAIQKSIESNDGVLHAFIEGLKELGRIAGRVVEGAENLVTVFAKWIGLKDSSAVWTGIFVAIGVAVALTATALLAWPLIIAAIVTVIGYVAENWDKVKKGAEAAWAVVKDSTIYKFLDGVVERIKSAVEWWNKFRGKGAAEANLASRAPEAGAEGPTAPIPQFAGGGEVHGPGSTTSDSIMARLSRGEFVNNAKSVAHYGADFFHALNNMTLPGFASGGLVAAPVRMGGGGAIQATSVLNLSIDGRNFNGLKGPKSTIDDLSSFAIARQASAAGSNPSWMK